jgi:Putative adhesin
MASENQQVRIKHTEERQESELDLAAGTPLSLTVSNSNGEIRVFTGDRPTAVVRSTKRGSRSGRALEESFTRIDQFGNTIVVAVENVHWSNIGDLGRSIVDLVKGERPLVGFGETAIDVEIELPREIAEQATNKSRLNSANGDIEVEGLGGKVELNTASGDIRIGKGVLELTAHTASGQVTATDVDGRITVRSASGDIHVHRGRLQRLNVNTASGDVEVEAAIGGTETSSLHSVSGDVDLKLTAPAATLTLSTVSGDANIKPPFEKEGRGKWRLGSAGASGPTLSVKTVSGDLEVEGTVGEVEAIVGAEPASAPPPVPPVPPVPPAPPVPSGIKAEFRIDRGNGKQPEAEQIDEVVEAPDSASEAERMNVLQALERGEIDIDEAMSRLDAMDDQPAV